MQSDVPLRVLDGPIASHLIGGRQTRLAKVLRAGQAFGNNCSAGGGVGKSGSGREKGLEALYGFPQSKTVATWHGDQYET